MGAGPAGIAAAIYLHRAGLDPLLFERGEIGGLLRSANLVENYPGFVGGISGEDLVDRLSRQLDSLGLRVTKACVKRINRAGGAFLIESDAGEFSARSIIAATGTRPMKVNLPGSHGLLGSRVFHELVDMPLNGIAGRRIVVVGGGDAAFDYALNLLGRACEVNIVSRSEPKCLSLLRARANAAGAEIVVGVKPELVKNITQGVQLRCRRGREPIDLIADYILIACGREPNIGVLGPTLRKRVGVPSNIPRTKVPGLFLAGDVVRGAHRQTGIAVGDGIFAAMLADEYLRKGAGAR